MPYVQSKVAVNTAVSNGVTIAFDSNVTVGNTIIVIGLHSYAGCPPSFTDNLGNTYTARGSRLALNTEIFELFTAPVTTGGACTLTAAMSCGVFRALAIVEVSQIAAGNPFDQQTGTYNALATSPFAAGGITPSEAGEYILAFFSSAGTTKDLSDGGGAGLTERDSNANNDTTILDKVHASGAINPDVSFTGTITDARGVVASFKTLAQLAAGPSLFRGRSFSFFDDDEINRFEFWSPIAEEATVHNRAALLEVTGAIETTAEFFTVFERSAAIDASVSVTVSGERVVDRAASVNASAAIETSAESFSVVERSASLDASASIETSAVSFTVVERAVSFDSTSTITVTAIREVLRLVSCAMTASIETSAQFFSIVETSVLVSATGSIEVAGVVVTERQSQVSAMATIVVSGQTEQFRQVAITVSGDIAVSGTVVPPGVVEHERSASLDGTGAITANAEFFSTITAAAEFTTTATIDVDGLGISARLVMIEAVGAITVNHQRELQRSAQLAATGTITVNGTIAGVVIERATAFNVSASIAVSGEIHHPASPQRTFMIESSERTLVVPRELRSFKPSEPDRTRRVL